MDLVFKVMICMDYKEGEGYSFQSIKLKGDSKTKSITGTILWEKLTIVTIDDKRRGIQKYYMREKSFIKTAPFN